MLNSLLIWRTSSFKNVPRTVEAICDFANKSKFVFRIRQWDTEIHVCEYTGFVDDSYKTVGCMLHPKAPGNNGIDFRGLCHYGSMACKSFFCPSASEIDETYITIVYRLITDWHLYGLVATDINYMRALFSLIEMMLECSIDAQVILRPKPSKILAEALSWKNLWPFAEKSTKRRSSYYLKNSVQPSDESGLVDNIVDSLNYTFDLPSTTNDAHSLVMEQVSILADAYKQAMLIDRKPYKLGN